MIKVDIIVPARNEEKNLHELTRRISQTCKAAQLDYKIILVVDPSTDRTQAVGQLLAEKYPLIVHKKQGQPGKAFSILEGIKLGSAVNIIMIDADLQYPPEAIPEMIYQLKSHGVVIAQRRS